MYDLIICTFNCRLQTPEIKKKYRIYEYSTCFNSFKGTVNVIVSDPSCKDGSVPLKPQYIWKKTAVFHDLKMFYFDNSYIFPPAAAEQNAQVEKPKLKIISFQNYEN